MNFVKNFVESVSTCLTKKYFDFNGRARRSEFWWFFLFNFVVEGVVRLIGVSVLSVLVGLALLLPGLGVAVRRLHDTGRPWPWILIGLIPFVGWIVLIVFYCQDSQGPNKWGPSPKGGAGGFLAPGAEPGYPPLPGR